TTHHYPLLLYSFPSRRSSDLHLNLRGDGATAGIVGDSLDPRHLRDQGRALVGVRLVNKQHVDAKLFKRQAFVLILFSERQRLLEDRKSTRLNSSHVKSSYAVF